MYVIFNRMYGEFFLNNFKSNRICLYLGSTSLISSSKSLFLVEIKNKCSMHNLMIHSTKEATVKLRV